jgi:hypothetical protein
MTVALARFTLKDANVFLLADALGDIDAPDSGLFWDDTRMLSRLQLQVADSRPSFLGAEVSHDNVLFTAQLTKQALARARRAFDPPRGYPPRAHALSLVRAAVRAAEDHQFQRPRRTIVVEVEFRG